MQGRRSRKSSSFPRIAGVQWSSTVESTLWGMTPGMRLSWRRSWSCGDRAGVLVAPAGGMAVAVEGSVLQAWRGDVPRVLQARVLSWSRSEPLLRVVPMPFEGPAEGKV